MFLLPTTQILTLSASPRAKRGRALVIIIYISSSDSNPIYRPNEKICHENEKKGLFKPISGDSEDPRCSSVLNIR